jgi:hypothetical protein
MFCPGKTGKIILNDRQGRSNRTYNDGIIFAVNCSNYYELCPQLFKLNSGIIRDNYHS